NTMSRSPKKPHSSTTLNSAPSGLFTPPPSQTDQVPPATAMLMSPPPEETLRVRVPSSSAVSFKVGFTGRVISNTLGGKRKRRGPSSSTASLGEDVIPESNDPGPSKLPPDATPNPKPRKQTKRGQSSVPQSPTGDSTSHPITPTKPSRAWSSASPTKGALLISPHVNNPAADYIPPIPTLSREYTSARRRSATPIPQYEPPAERFTPPREIICSPLSATHTPKSKSKRKAAAIKSTGKPKKLILQIKKEFPDDVDLSAPLPPPSPTDDPLLLRGSTTSQRRRRPRSSSHPLETSLYARHTPPMPSTSPIRGSDMDETRLMDLNMDSMIDPTSDDTMSIPSRFDFTIPTKNASPSSLFSDRTASSHRSPSPYVRPLANSQSSRGAFPDQLDETTRAEHRSPSPVAGPSQANDLFSPRRALHSPIPEPAVHDPPPPPEPPVQSLNGQSLDSYSEQDAYRSPRSHDDDGMDDSEGEAEDEISVVRELSQPPDFEEEDSSGHGYMADSFAKFNLTSPNPFDVAHDFEETASPHPISRRPLGSLVASRSQIFEQTVAESVAEYDVSDDDDLEDMDLKVIKITSEDPLAAARAAAILRLHKYDCLEQPSSKRRHSAAGVDPALRKSRRKSLMDGGISKSSTLKRRQSLGGMVGDKVFIPGSPVMTLPQLLHEVEQSLHIEDMSVSSSPFRPISPLAYKTLSRESSLYESVLRSKVSSVPGIVGPRGWCKDDWKKLDSCYTDERIAMAEESGLPNGEMVSADEVDLDAIVDRFIELIGGESAMATLGPSWTRNDLMKRARALQRKQRSGHIAPPTPGRFGSVLSSDASTAPYRRFMSSMSPEASLHSSDATIAELDCPDTPSPSHVKYNELMDEALSITPTPVAKNVSFESEARRTPPPSSIANRVKGFLFSYLPLMSKKTTPDLPKNATGLPIPPADLFLRERPPIATPAPKPVAKPIPPKELVQLHPAPFPEKPSMIPRPADKKPGRLVELNHVSPPPENKSLRSSTSSIRERRDSNASVKDLVKAFETIDRQVVERGSLLDLRRQRSIQDWSATSAKNGHGPQQKPTWKP
ncbi:hypothetical protein BXZ70DRAFT_900722, partial [Cristinia sonorae]